MFTLFWEQMREIDRKSAASMAILEAKYQAEQQARENEKWQEDLSQFVSGSSKPSSSLNILTKPSSDHSSKPSLDVLPEPSLPPISEPTFVPVIQEQPIVLAIPDEVRTMLFSYHNATIERFKAFDNLSDQISPSEPTPSPDVVDIVHPIRPIPPSADFVAATEEVIEDLDSCAGIENTAALIINAPRINIVKATAATHIVLLREDEATSGEVVCGEQCKVFDPGGSLAPVGKRKTMVLRSDTRSLASQSAAHDT